MNFFDAVLLGIVEGITEFLPISSTAHLMMTSKILGLTQSEFVKSFEIVIQLGAITAVILLFGKRLFEQTQIWKKVCIAFIPTAVIGFLLYKIIKDYLIGNLSIMVWTLIIGGLVLIAVEYFFFKYKPGIDSPTPEKLSDMGSISNTKAFWIGVCQAVSVVPGVSRAAATIIPAIFFGASRQAAAEFSFLLAIPTVAAAAGYDLFKNYSVISFSSNFTLLATGFIVSFLAAIVGIKFMVSFLSKHSLTSFGLYRILVAIVFFLLFLN